MMDILTLANLGGWIAFALYNAWCMNSTIRDNTQMLKELKSAIELKKLK